MNRNEILFDRAKAIIPGGVNSPVRAFGSVGGVPRFIKKAEGAYVWDENGTRYTDYVGSWGPAIVGHAHPETIERVFGDGHQLDVGEAQRLNVVGQLGRDVEIGRAHV